MSKVLQVLCDAPKCTSVRGKVNHWWLLRAETTGWAFTAVPMVGSTEMEGDRHFCSSTCMHGMLESWMQSHTDQPKPEPLNDWTSERCGVSEE